MLIQTNSNWRCSGWEGWWVDEGGAIHCRTRRSEPPKPRSMRGFSSLLHADWSVSAGKRWVARSRRTGDGWIIETVEAVGDCAEFVRSIGRSARDEAVLVGFDFPIGVPEVYGAQTGLKSFPDLLQQIGQGRWSAFGSIARQPHEIALERPFYPAGASAGLKQKDLLTAHGVSRLDDLRRSCERKTEDRRAACPLFWTLGGNQVGRAALAGWTEVLKPALAAGARLWPFDGSLDDLGQGAGLVLAETYPAEAHGHVGVIFGSGESKTRQSDRAGKAAALLQWADENRVELSPAVEALILDGFGSDKAGEDRFDALLGLCGMIEVASGRRPEGANRAEGQWEGWILGQCEGSSVHGTADSAVQQVPLAVSADEKLRAYGLRPFADVRLEHERFVIEVIDEDTAALEKCIYAFVVGGEIVRIGSSKARLGHRMKIWQRDVTRRLGGHPSSTPPWEAAAWKERLIRHGGGAVYARQGTWMSTPVGSFNAYLDEESLLIGRHLPPLNRSKHR